MSFMSSLESRTDSCIILQILYYSRYSCRDCILASQQLQVLYNELFKLLYLHIIYRNMYTSLPYTTLSMSKYNAESQKKSQQKVHYEKKPRMHALSAYLLHYMLMGTLFLQAVNPCKNRSLGTAVGGFGAGLLLGSILNPCGQATLPPRSGQIHNYSLPPR